MSSQANQPYLLPPGLNEPIERLEKQSNRGGAREGAGRPKGQVSEISKYNAAVSRAVKAKIVNQAGQLLNAQLTLARGVSHLYRRIGSRVEIVEDPEEIAAYLADPENYGTDVSDEFGGDVLNAKRHAEYFYITTKEPNLQAIIDLMNRAFGKPKESIELTTDPDNPITPADASTAHLALRFREIIQRETKANAIEAEVTEGKDG